MRYVGLDAHLRQSTLCVLDDRGRKLMTRTAKGSWAAVCAELERIAPPFAICFEASAGYGFLFERLQRIARRVVVAHPGHLRLIFRSKRKNDRIDAEKLAEVLFLDEVPAVYVSAGSTHAWRRMIVHRRKLVVERTRAKNALRALSCSRGIEAPRGLWSRRGLTWLAAVGRPTRARRPRVAAVNDRFRVSLQLEDPLPEHRRWNTLPGLPLIHDRLAGGADPTS